MLKRTIYMHKFVIVGKFIKTEWRCQGLVIMQEKQFAAWLTMQPCYVCNSWVDLCPTSLSFWNAFLLLLCLVITFLCVRFQPKHDALCSRLFLFPYFRFTLACLPFLKIYLWQNWEFHESRFITLDSKELGILEALWNLCDEMHVCDLLPRELWRCAFILVKITCSDLEKATP